ncbi:MAG TPA: bifunctional diaminohydroxyphosphoribosylaminopyrimidine deaminase/5-amino-6-(5-phosphoribosylamino)uracil reductase RibD [Planctomycetota bacterium]|nr:bifunctional diaminohydroxyphosphoribosylaminopyrimidine deaminase/5-amino-6-(5-phosphoribosylamino)uracil reductase RibD [Planctomycetota bacterium]
MSTLPNPMALALQLAYQAGAWASPNPMVGCVIARPQGEGQWEVLAHGYHERCGLPHAEARALAMFRDLPADRKDGAVLFVTLEPCNHTGRTPPCAQAIIDSGIRAVEIATADPNPQAAGGAEALKAAGVRVGWGNLFDAATELNAGFFKRTLEQRPLVVAKWAMTADGKIATAKGDSRWISGPAARAGVMRLRATCDAVLVGIGTALHDDPQLTARIEGAHQPLRIIVDTHGRLPATANVLHGPGSRKMPDPLARGVDAANAPSSAEANPALLPGIASGCVIATGPTVPSETIHRWQETGAEAWSLPLFEGKVDLAHLMEELVRRRSIGSVLVEGGAGVLGSLFDRHLVDRVAVHVAPKILGGAGPSAVAGQGAASMGEATELVDSHFEQIGEDILLVGKPRPWAWLAAWEVETRRRAAATGRWTAPDSASR